MSQILCEDLEEIKLVEVYMRDHISEIATNEEVLGGTWHVLSVFINPSTKNGEVIYEDGHIESSAQFEYKLKENREDITIMNFQVNP